MMRLSVFFVLIFAAVLSFSQADDINVRLLDKELARTRADWNVPAMAVAIVSNGHVAYERGFGVLEEGKNDKADEHTNFAIASNTKAFTAAALAILVDEGRIAWSDKVRKYIPWFELYDPYVSHEFTIRDLLTHRSGLATFSGDLIWYASDYSRNDIIRRAKFLKPVAGFREKFGYSNIMYLAAGQIVEAVTDTTWDDFVEARIFKPLAMSRTNTAYDDNARLPNVAACHASVDGKNVAIPYVRWDNIAPAGGINSNAHDMAQWLLLQLGKGKFAGQQIYSEQAAADMWTAQTIIEVRPFTNNINPSTHLKAYALGWNLYDYKGHLIVTHNGGADGMISQTLLIPELNCGFVVLTNNLSMCYNVVMCELLDYLIDGKFDNYWNNYFHKVMAWVDSQERQQREEWEQSRVPNAPPSLPLNDYAGTYTSDIYGDVVVTCDNDKLLLNMTHTDIFKGELQHWHFNTFEIEFKQVPSLPKGSVNFLLDSYGKISEMQINIPNPDFDFTELKLMRK